MRLIDLIERSSARLEQAGVSFGHGTTNAFDEAAWLVLWKLGLPLDALDEAAEQALNAQQCESVEALVDQRITTRQPAAYLTGEAWLQGVPFFVDARTIVPRSLIAEVLCEGTLDAWLDGWHEAGLEAGAKIGTATGTATGTETGTDEARAPQVLDLCTGNGSLAILAALCWPQAQVEGTDLSSEALALAQRNVQRHDLEARVTLRQGDGLAAARGPYDLILCNPPYVNRSAMQTLPPEYRAEPALALDGGPDGMDFIRPLLAQAAAHLRPGGALVLEIGHERAHFEAAFPTLSPLWLSTSAGDDQVLLLTREDLAS